MDKAEIWNVILENKTICRKIIKAIERARKYYLIYRYRSQIILASANMLHFYIL